MRNLLSVLCVALLMVGCGGEQGAEDSNDVDDNASALPPPVVDPAKVPDVDPAKVPFVEKWAEWEANPEPYGGLEALAWIRKMEESNATRLALRGKKITDLTPLTELTNLTSLTLDVNQITDLAPLAGLTKLKSLNLFKNKITDLTPLAELTKLEKLYLHGNQITDLTPLAGLTNLKTLYLDGNLIPDDQKAMLRKALPNCKIDF